MNRSSFQRQPAVYPNPQTPNSRSSYPSFLPFQTTALLHIKAAGHGLLDASRWDKVVTLVASDPEVRSNILKSLLLNIVSLVSIYFFDLLLHPLSKDEQKWLHRNVGWFYQILWLLPVVGVSLYLNSTWCSLLAKRTFTLKHGSRAAAPQPSTYTGILNSIATSAYRVIMVFTSVVVTFALGYLPLVGPTLGFIFLCWVDSYYCFEFIWIASGLSLSRRLRHLEERWAYYFAFGLPTAALCMLGSTLANAAIFALVFPAYIIMAMHSRPLPLDPYNPSGEEILRHPSPYLPIRIPIFHPVTFLNDWIIRILNAGASVAGGSRAPKISRHQRSLSDGVESVEEGEAIPLQSPPPTAPPIANTFHKSRVRIGRGDRRKFD
ncbi:etoposide-induced protein 2.4-domain-containing protein [Abortiporus biennis]|nr:etoposide-induced protein 2.4-domain-containing protein [Abortiporus biennis]